ncbi:hypothetical protein [uncultured Nostoc sp.]|uniref:hypothetical protein n=1 Tax=uncultured Nostoc sp. TaxID=340711 RepID=UPI0035CC3676
MAKYKVTMTITGSDYEEIRGLFGKVTRKGTMAEITVDANDPETAKSNVSKLLGELRNRIPLLGATKL